MHGWVLALIVDGSPSGMGFRWKYAFRFSLRFYWLPSDFNNPITPLYCLCWIIWRLFKNFFLDRMQFECDFNATKEILVASETEHNSWIPWQKIHLSPICMQLTLTFRIICYRLSWMWIYPVGGYRSAAGSFSFYFFDSIAFSLVRRIFPLTNNMREKKIQRETERGIETERIWICNWKSIASEATWTLRRTTHTHTHTHHTITILTTTNPTPTPFLPKPHRFCWNRGRTGHEKKLCMIRCGSVGSMIHLYGFVIANGMPYA